MRISVVIADGHGPTREGARRALESHGVTVSATTETADETLKAVVKYKPDACLIAVDIPGGGIKIAHTLARRVPATAVVMLSSSDDDEALFASIRAGARGYLLQNTNPARLAAALRGVVAGEAALPRPLVMKLISEFRHDERRELIPLLRGSSEKLTQREWEVLELWRSGLTTQQVAQHLGISEVTVRRHGSTVIRKLRVGDRAAAIEVVEELDR